MYKHTISITHSHIHPAHTVQLAILFDKKRLLDLSPEETVNTIRETTDCENPVNSDTACNTPLRAPGRNLWIAASIVFLSVDGSVLFPRRINNISMSDRERESKEKTRQRLKRNRERNI